MSERCVSRSIVVPAPPEEIFALLTDPNRHAEIDGSGTVRGRLRASEVPLRLGSRFGMAMRFGPLPYAITNWVVEYEENRRIAWRHWGGHRWRYQLEPVDGGTKVTESFDYSTALAPPVIELIGYPKRNTGGIEATLQRLHDRFAGTGGD